MKLQKRDFLFSCRHIAVIRQPNHSWETGVGANQYVRIQMTATLLLLLRSFHFIDLVGDSLPIVVVDKLLAGLKALLVSNLVAQPASKLENHFVCQRRNSRCFQHFLGGIIRTFSAFYFRKLLQFALFVIGCFCSFRIDITLFVSTFIVNLVASVGMMDLIATIFVGDRYVVLFINLNIFSGFFPSARYISLLGAFALGAPGTYHFPSLSLTA